MKIRIEEKDYCGTATEIMDSLRQEADIEIRTTAGYIRFVQDNLQRMSGQPCTLDGGNTELRANSLFHRLDGVGALEIITECGPNNVGRNRRGGATE